ncbi:MAG: hypothetical protein ACR2IJ_02175 [Fluviibacter sp.]
MKDYRLNENRLEYFTALYKMNLEQRVMPGLVYLYMPKLAEYYRWDDEQKLWFATLNGFTQNPITSLRIFDQLPECPPAGAALSNFDAWFNANWDTLNFDSDRLKNKRNTVAGIKSYAQLVSEHGGFQTLLWSPEQSYADAWGRASSVHSFGRLSTFSYLEYVRIMGWGVQCHDLMFEDFDGSRSHRNGALFLQGADTLVYDKRSGNEFNGKYDNFPHMCSWLTEKSNEFLRGFVTQHPDTPDVGYFTLESQYCQFKNGFFRRRYPGVYADMAWDRIKWYDERNMTHYTELFKAIRAANLPDWLREECEPKPLERAKKAAQFADTGLPYRAEYFL